MKKIAFLLLLAATAFTACKKDKDKPADPSGYQLLGTWEGPSPSSLNVTGGLSDRYTFKSDSSYFRIYFGDMGEGGKFEVVPTSDPAVLKVTLIPPVQQPSITITIEWINADLIKVSDNLGSERQFNRV